MADDIRMAYGMAYTALCSAGGQELTFSQEVENPSILFLDDTKKDAYEVEISLEFTLKFYASIYNG